MHHCIRRGFVAAYLLYIFVLDKEAHTKPDGPTPIRRYGDGGRVWESVEHRGSGLLCGVGGVRRGVRQREQQ